MLSAASAAGVSVAFGAPIGGVLFSLEEVGKKKNTAIKVIYIITIKVYFSILFSFISSEVGIDFVFKFSNLFL